MAHGRRVTGHQGALVIEEEDEEDDDEEDETHVKYVFMIGIEPC